MIIVFLRHLKNQLWGSRIYKEELALKIVNLLSLPVELIRISSFKMKIMNRNLKNSRMMKPRKKKL